MKMYKYRISILNTSIFEKLTHSVIFPGISSTQFVYFNTSAYVRKDTNVTEKVQKKNKHMDAKEYSTNKQLFYYIILTDKYQITYSIFVEMAKTLVGKLKNSNTIIKKTQSANCTFSEEITKRRI